MQKLGNVSLSYSQPKITTFSHVHIAKVCHLMVRISSLNENFLYFRLKVNAKYNSVTVTETVTASHTGECITLKSYKMLQYYCYNVKAILLDITLIQ